MQSEPVVTTLCYSWMLVLCGQAPHIPAVYRWRGARGKNGWYKISWQKLQRDVPLGSRNGSKKASTWFWSLRITDTRYRVRGWIPEHEPACGCRVAARAQVMDD